MSTKAFRFPNRWYDVVRVKTPDDEEIDCMVSADWPDGESPKLNIGISETCDGADGRGVIIDDTQLQITMVDLFKSYALYVAAGNKSLESPIEDHLPSAYDCVISYLGHLKDLMCVERDILINISKKKKKKK